MNGVGTGGVNKTYCGASRIGVLYRFHVFRCGGESVGKMATAKTISEQQVEHGDEKYGTTKTGSGDRQYLL